MFMGLKAFSFGGGVQSTAALVLAAQGRIDYRTFLFCNVGEDSENPETLTYVHEVAMPFARDRGLDLIELCKVRRDGTVDTIYRTITRPDSRSIGIPVHMSNGAPGRRACTLDFKIRVVDRWLKRE
jgi:3'-phosphoadenosine 5'-phosphosulfate sulfotransferase (PAPS reductase)/FAD synthetase